jgi:phosphohistidine phosphatase
MIYLMRHADAVSDEVDVARPLSPRGRAQVAKVCELLKPMDFAPVEVWHSPLVRSRETAALLVAGLGLEAPLLLKPGIEPEDDPRRAAALLGDEQRTIAIVSHEPFLGILSSIMVHGPQIAAVYFPFPKAAVMALNPVGSGWKSKWLVRSA